MERRKHVRHSGDISLEARLTDSGDCLGRVVDLSEAGAMLYCTQLPEEETLWPCRLVATDPNVALAAVELTLDCLWTRPASDGTGGWAGFQITSLDADQQRNLIHLLSAFATPGQRDATTPV